MEPALGCGDHKCFAFDGPRPQNTMPMRLAGGYRERRRQSNDIHVGLRIGAKQVRKSHVIADCKAHEAKRRLNYYGLASTGIGRGFLPRFPRVQIDIKQVHLVVSGLNLAICANDDGAVCKLLTIFMDNGYRPKMQPYSMLRCAVG